MSTVTIECRATHKSTVSGQVPVSLPNQKVEVAMTGTGAFTSIQKIGTTEELLVIPSDVSPLSYLFVKNLDPTNFVSLGTTGNMVVRLLPGEVALFRPVPGINLFAQADTADVEIQLYGWEL